MGIWVTHMEPNGKKLENFGDNFLKSCENKQNIVIILEIEKGEFSYQ